jgi:hypothetical protein
MGVAYIRQSMRALVLCSQLTVCVLAGDCPQQGAEIEFRFAGIGSVPLTGLAPNADKS